MLSKILRGAVLATFAVGATVAQADPFAYPLNGDRTGDFYWDGQKIANGYVNQHGVVVGEPSFSGTAGLFKGRFNPVGDGALDPSDAFTFFCIDVGQFVSSAGVLNTTYTRVTHFPGLNDTDNWGELRNLFNAYSWPTNVPAAEQARQSAAMQLAIWNIIYDDDARVDQGDGAGLNDDFIAGFTSLEGEATIKLANEMMTAARNYNPTLSGTYYLFEFKSSANQDFIAFTRNGNPPDRLPLPGTLALFGIGLAGLGLARRKS